MSKTNNGALPVRASRTQTGNLGFENKSWASTYTQQNFKKDGCMHA